MSEKKRRLFYKHEGVDAFVPYEEDNFINYFDGLYDGDKLEVEFAVKLMTDEEFDNLEDI